MRNIKRKIVFPQHHLTLLKGNSAQQNSPQTKSPDIMDHEWLPMMESFLTQPPLLKDTCVTRTSKLQNATVAECLPLLNGVNDPSADPFDYDEYGVKQLDREAHIAFAEEGLTSFPAPFVSIDASRPWMIYWALTALHFLGEDVTAYRDRVVKSFFPLQNSSGGFGGGQGHFSHLAGTYATILSLAMVGGTQAYQLTDRQAMWSWLGRLKQADGGFQICEGGEEDTRAAYCALLVIALLDLPWWLPADAPARSSGCKTFGDGLGNYISRCQTYEGGISSEPGTEAHGAYTFCAIAALCLLDAPHVSLPKYLNLDQLVSWLSARQYAPEGGLAGRTNKVVDGCYSHWIGNCFPLVQAALTGPVQSEEDTDTGDLYRSEALDRYILNCCQNAEGGLRDKPSKGPDSYHTCYTLAGLSTGEHYHYYTQSVTTDTDQERFRSAFAWQAVRREHRRQGYSEPMVTGQSTDELSDTKATRATQSHSTCGLSAVHPVFVIPHEAVWRMREWSLNQPKLS